MKKIIDWIKDNKVISIIIASVVVLGVLYLLSKKVKGTENTIPETTVEVTAPAEVK